MTERKNFNRARLVIASALLFALALGGSLAGFKIQNAEAAAGAPPIVNFQARLTNASDAAITVATQMRFEIFDSLSGGACVWSAKGSGSADGCATPDASQLSVTPVAGVFSVPLGDTSFQAENALPATIFNDDSRYLEVRIFNGSGWETLSPRKQILSAAYALGGGGASQWTASGSDIYFNTGNVGIGTTTPIGEVHIARDISPTYNLSGGQGANAQLILSGASDLNTQMRFGVDTTNYVGTIQTTEFGSGVFPLSINPSGGNVGIGTTTPATNLQVNGRAFIGSVTPGYDNPSDALTLTGGMAFVHQGGDEFWHAIEFKGGDNCGGCGSMGIGIESSGSFADSLQIRDAADTPQLTVKNFGGVGIGTATPTTPLTVNGLGDSASGVLSVVNTGTAGDGNAAVLNALAPSVAPGNSVFLTYGIAQSGNNQAQFRFNYAGDGSTSNYLGLGFYGADNLLNVMANGAVGIGTTDPGLPLDVRQGDENWPTTSGTTQTGVLRLGSAASGSTGVLDMGTAPNANTWLQATDRGDLSRKYNLVLNPNGGNVGIGSQSANGVLDVEGGTAGNDSDGNSILLYAQNAGNSGNDHNGGNIILMPGTATNSGTPGYVGIGTTSPAATLDVNGDAKLNGILNMNTHRITMVDTPIDPNDAVNKAYADDVISNIAWQPAVIDFFDPTGGLPGSPTTGDRYIASATANGWTANDIEEWNGASWDATTPSTGFAVWVMTPASDYVFNGTSWVVFSSTMNHNSLAGLQGGGPGEHYHLTLAEYTGTGTGTFVRAAAPTISTLNLTGGFRLNGSNSGFVGFDTLADAGSTTYTLPSADGASGNVLTTNGSGSLSWAAGGSSTGWTSDNSTETNTSYNVGIGTADPQSKLEVQNDGNNIDSDTKTAQLRISGATDPHMQLDIGYDTNSNHGVIQAIQDTVSNTDLLLEPSGGNVGIGTTTTTANLHILGDGTNATLILGRYFNGVSDYRAAGLWEHVGANSVEQLVFGVSGDGGPAPEDNPNQDNNTKMVIQANGAVGIGTTNPAGELSVASADAGSWAGGLSNWSNAYSVFGPNAGDPNGAALALGYSTTDDIANIVSLSPNNAWKPMRLAGSELRFASGAFGDTMMTLDGSGIAFPVNGTAIDFASSSTDNNFDWKISTSTTCASASDQGIVIKETGGTQVGHICYDSGTGLNYYAALFNTGATDVAENYSTDPADNLASGDLVAFDPARGGLFVKKAVAGSETAIGVISTAPGVKLTGIDEATGQSETSNSMPVALSGRVPTAVSNANGTINIGDPITASDIAGVGVKATKPGRIIGFALEAYASATPGKIKVFIQPGWNDGVASSSAPVVDNSASGANSAALSSLSSTATSDLDMSGFSISRVMQITGVNGRWMIDTNGVLKQIASADGVDVTTFSASDDNVKVSFDGKGKLEAGRAKIVFTDAEKSVMAAGIPYNVIVTLTDSANGIYVFNETADGFNVNELNGGTSGATFDWTVKARRKGYEDVNNFGVAPGADTTTDTNTNTPPADTNTNTPPAGTAPDSNVNSNTPADNANANTPPADTNTNNPPADAAPVSNVNSNTPADNTNANTPPVDSNNNTNSDLTNIPPADTNSNTNSDATNTPPADTNTNIPPADANTPAQ